MKKFLTLMVALFLSSSVFASSFTGVVGQVRIAQASSGITRVSVYTGNTTSCGGVPGWYSFEYAANGSGPGQAWLASVLDAKLTQANFTLVGTGTCDSYGLETVYYMQNN